MVANVSNNSDPSKWETFSYRRVIETFDPNDKPVIATSPDGNAFHVWYVVSRDHARKMFTSPSNPGELTDKGRQTTFELGKRLRRLYVDRLGFLPSIIDDPQIVYLRSTSAPRALESLIHTFGGLYSASQRAKDVARPTIVIRRAEDETMLPNVSDCQRMADLVREFGNRAARKWDNHVDMEYINEVYGRWLPPGSDRISLHSNPSLLTILDTVNSTLAHGSQTRLPSEFYDAKAIRVMDRIVREEYFGGYGENAEYRMLGVGSFMGDMLHSMLDSIPACPSSFSGAFSAVGSETKCRKRFALLSCHDSTLVAILMSLGAFKGSIETWPPFSSHIAVELLKDDSDDQSRPFPTTEDDYQLDGYYVRLRYNDEPVVIPGCEGLGSHLPGHEDFCTLVSALRA